MGSPTCPSSRALRGDTTADPRVPLYQATTQSPLPLQLSRLPTPTERPGGAGGSPGSAPATSRTWLPASRKAPPAGQELGSQRHHHTEVTVQSGALSPGQGEIPPAANGPRPHPEAKR